MNKADVEAYHLNTPREAQNFRGMITTYSKKLVDPWNLKPEDIYITDIAMALSCENRYIGHNGFPYSVANHSLSVAKIFEEAGAGSDLVLAALLHDAEEGYLKDMPSPIKARPEMAAYLEAGKRARKVIFEKFGLDHDALMPIIKPEDDAMYFRERRNFYAYEHATYAELPDDDKIVFLDQLHSYTQMVKLLVYYSEANDFTKVSQS